ncbi:N-6 DNA methylase [Roseomonas aeriglobus]|nr:N-6 DNA methylase [Roseomonas aeriglobus]
MSLEIAENLSRRLGLAHGLLLGLERDVQQRHHALLDGVDGSFSLSSGPIDVERVLDWTWSSQLATHVTVDADTLTARQVASDARPLIFKRDQVDRQPEGFLSAIISKRVEPAIDVVQHVVGCFRSHRHVAAAAHLTNTEALETFLRVMAQEIRGPLGADAIPDGIVPDAQGRLPGDHEHRLREELRFSRLAGRRAELALTMRHAAGMVFQEAHADLLTEPLQPQLFGLAPVPDRANRTQLGAYYTPPGLARNLADLAIADHLHKSRIKIVDPACGSGIFLCEVLRALERRGYQGAVELIGLDVSASAIAMARFALDHGGFADRPGVTATVRVADFLRLADRLDADIVLMNPPFLAMPEMDADVRERLQQILGDAFRYRPDLSMAFTSLAQHHLRPGGTLATLLPAGALSQTGGVKWRDGLLRGNEVELIAVLGEHGLFRDAIVNIAALVLRKSEQPAESAPTMLWASQKRGASSAALRRLRRWTTGNRNAERTIDWSIYPTSQRMLAERDDWTPRPYSLGELPERLASTPGIAAVEDLFHVELGVRAGTVGATLQIESDEYERLPAKERRLFRPVAETRSIRNGRIQPITWIFYPDEPMTSTQIQRAAPTFHARYLAQLGVADGDRIDLDRARRETNLARRPRLVARAFIGPDSFAVDGDGSFVVVQGYSWIPKQPVVGAPFDTAELLQDYAFLLNSRLFFALLRENGRIVGGGQVDGAKNQVRRVPLPDLGAMYLETPELLDQARELRQLDQSERPSAQMLDAFTAAAYRTSLEEWSLP